MSKQALTVSGVKWYQTSFGKCQYCNRKRPLGRVNVEGCEYEACIDCHFGIPMEYWQICPKCGSLEVNPEAFCYECSQKK